MHGRLQSRSIVGSWYLRGVDGEAADWEQYGRVTSRACLAHVIATMERSNCSLLESDHTINHKQRQDSVPETSSSQSPQHLCTAPVDSKQPMAPVEGSGSKSGVLWRPVGEVCGVGEKVRG